MNWRIRFRMATRASFLGWIAGLLAAMPFQVVEAVRNAAGTDLTVFHSLRLALGFWGFLSFGVAAYSCIFFVFPTVWIVPPEWIARRGVLWVRLSALFGVVLIGMRSHVWTSFAHDGVGMLNFWVWSVYFSAFCGVTAFCYWRALAGLEKPSLGG